MESAFCELFWWARQEALCSAAGSAAAWTPLGAPWVFLLGGDSTLSCSPQEQRSPETADKQYVFSCWRDTNWSVNNCMCFYVCILCWKYLCKCKGLKQSVTSHFTKNTVRDNTCLVGYHSKLYSCGMNEMCWRPPCASVLCEWDAALLQSECRVPIRCSVLSARGVGRDERSAWQTEKKCCFIQVLSGGA